METIIKGIDENIELQRSNDGGLYCINVKTLAGWRITEYSIEDKCLHGAVSRLCRLKAENTRLKAEVERLKGITEKIIVKYRHGSCNGKQA